MGGYQLPGPRKRYGRRTRRVDVRRGRALVGNARSCGRPRTSMLVSRPRRSVMRTGPDRGYEAGRPAQQAHGPAGASAIGPTVHGGKGGAPGRFCPHPNGWGMKRPGNPGNRKPQRRRGPGPGNPSCIASYACSPCIPPRFAREEMVPGSPSGNGVSSRPSSPTRWRGLYGRNSSGNHLCPSDSPRSATVNRSIQASTSNSSDVFRSPALDRPHSIRTSRRCGRGGSGCRSFPPSPYAPPGASSPTACAAAASARSRVARGSRMRNAGSRYVAS